MATKFTRSPPNFPQRLAAASEWSTLFLLHRAVGLLSEFESAPRTKATFLVCETCLRLGGRKAGSQSIWRTVRKFIE